MNDFANKAAYNISISAVGLRLNKCKNCGTSHPPARNQCPARNNTCRLCAKLGHCAKCCLTYKFRQPRSYLASSAYRHQAPRSFTPNNYGATGNACWNPRTSHARVDLHNIEQENTPDPQVPGQHPYVRYS